MKRYLSLIVAAACLIFATGHASAQELSFQSFLSEIATALVERSSLTQTPNESETVYWETLVSYENAVFEKYKGFDFGTDKLNRLMSVYQDGLHLQTESAYFFERNQRVYSALWNAGLKARSAVLVELYEDYDLPVTKETMTNFYNNLTTTVSYTLSALPSTTATPTVLPTATPTAAPTATPPVTLSSSEQALLKDAEERLQSACDVILILADVDTITGIDVSYLQNQSAFVCYVKISSSSAVYQQNAGQSQSFQNATQKMMETLYGVIHTEVQEITQKPVDITVALVDSQNVVVCKYKNGSW